MLIPANDPTPNNPCSKEKIPPGGVAVLFGNQAAIAIGEGRVVILKMAGEEKLWFEKADSGIHLNAIINDEVGNEVARIARTTFRATSENGYYADRPDGHTLVILNPNDAHILYIRYLNPSAIEVRGVFTHRDHSPIVIRPGEGVGILRGKAGSRYFDYSDNCFQGSPNADRVTVLFDIP